MKEKIMFFLFLGWLITFLILFYMVNANKVLKGQNNALNEDVLRYKQSLEEKEKQNEVLLEAKKEYELFKQDLANDDSDNLNVVVPAYVLNRMHTD